MARYVVEWGSPSQLQGKINRDTLKPGDHVVITGNPGRNTDDHRVRLLTFKRPKDGWSWGLLPDEVIAK
jgi:thiamine monophosphate kinase